MRLGERLTFWNIFWFWIAAVVAVSLVNAAVIHDPWLLSSIVRSGLGITLLICPRYPISFSERWGEEKSRKLIRSVAVLEILASFFVRIYY